MLRCSHHIKLRLFFHVVRPVWNWWRASASVRNSLCVRVENAALLLAAELLVAGLEPPVPSWGRFSMEGNWNGRDTGTRPPSIPKPRGRDEAELSRLSLPVVETWTEDRQAERGTLPVNTGSTTWSFMLNNGLTTPAFPLIPEEPPRTEVQNGPQYDAARCFRTFLMQTTFRTCLEDGSVKWPHRPVRLQDSSSRSQITDEAATSRSDELPSRTKRDV